MPTQMGRSINQQERKLPLACDSGNPQSPLRLAAFPCVALEQEYGETHRRRDAVEKGNQFVILVAYTGRIDGVRRRGGGRDDGMQPFQAGGSLYCQPSATRLTGNDDALVAFVLERIDLLLEKVEYFGIVLVAIELKWSLDQQKVPAVALRKKTRVVLRMGARLNGRIAASAEEYDDPL